MKFGITPPYRANVASDPEWMTYFVRNAESTGGKLQGVSWRGELFGARRSKGIPGG